MRGCWMCDALWQEYAKLANLRLALIESQRDQAVLVLDPRIRRAADAQMRVRRRIAEHCAKGHDTRLAA